MKKLTSLHEELFILPWQQGVKLITSQQNEKRLSIENFGKLPLVKELLQTPINVYFLNQKSEIQTINENTLKNCGFPEEKSTIGKTIRIAAERNVAEKIIKNDLEVMASKKMNVFEEHFIGSENNKKFLTLSFKFPWYAYDETIIGILGCSIIVDEKNILANSLNHLIRFGLLSNISNKNIFTKKNNQPTLSKQESQCLNLLIRGGTSKTIASKLKISSRTVESYLENVKNKFNVSKKSELIEKALELISSN